MNWTDKIQVYNADCMDIMANYDDDFFDLAIVDPPYGIKRAGHEQKKIKSTGWKTHEFKDWDNAAPNKEYFDELMRVSKNQIIWGANYFVEYLPPSMGWIVWTKNRGKFTCSDAELAFSSFNRALREFRKNPIVMTREPGEVRHPTQKPICLYDWLLLNYAKPDDIILDTHLGSGNHAIACHHYGCSLVATELDKDYYQDAHKTFKNVTAQKRLF